MWIEVNDVIETRTNEDYVIWVEELRSYKDKLNDNMLNGFKLNSVRNYKQIR